jgi:hypothetical protein
MPLWSLRWLKGYVILPLRKPSATCK